MIRRYRQSDATFEADVRGLLTLLREGGLTESGAAALDVPGIVSGILGDIASRGDDAVLEWERTLDKAELTPATIRVSAEAIAQAHAEAEPAFLALVRRVAANIREYQEHILIQAPPLLSRGGRTLGVRYTPIDRVGLYVPGMNALYPSTVLMTLVPAQVAGVKQIAIASPPLSNGDIDPIVLAVAGELGIEEVYRLGGAVAVGALAYGTEAVPATNFIAGPGNAFVAEAKRQVLGRVGIDSVAGPSEVLIVADESAPPAWVAADLLAQAEHNPGSAILITPSETLADAVVDAVEQQLAKLSRADAIRDALTAFSAILVVDDLAGACDLASDFATEHLQIMTADDAWCLDRIRNAGAIFVGPHTPVPLGDYYAGPSHVLPTGGTAKFFGPLSANDFRKATSILQYDAASLAADSDDVIDFATREGLTAHADAVRVRKC